MTKGPLQTIELDPGVEPRATVVVLHGLGADGTDFLPVADELKLDAVGPVRFVFPRAPVRPVSINGGAPMRAWYDIRDADLARREDEAGLRQSMALVQRLVEREVARGMPARRIVLAGFSQGCAMALLAGLRHPDRLAGIMGLSGYLPLAGKTTSEAHSANAQTPIFLAHGSEDPMVVLPRALASRDLLSAMGYRVSWHTYPMGHSVCAEEIADIGAWLRQVLAPR